MIKVVVAQAVRDLAQLANNVQGWPQTAKGASVKALNERKDYLIAKLRYRAIKKLRNIPGFSKGSQVEDDLIVDAGGYGLSGVSSVSIKLRTKKSFIIAEAWNKGAKIFPGGGITYLAEPISQGKRVPLSPKKFMDSRYTSFFYQNPSIVRSSRHPYVEQDVAGLMIIRDKKTLVAGKVQKKKVGKVVQTFVLMKSQTIKPTRWAFHALREFREQDVPVIAKDIVKRLKDIKVAP
jgi:hypothetical protein